MNGARPTAARISALISDVDGTLVTDDKVLTRETVEAVGRLRAAGLGFSIVSSRPPRGLHKLVEALDLACPFAGFNGGIFKKPRSDDVKELPLPPQVARQAIDYFEAQGIDIWLFTAEDWLLRDTGNPYIAREERTVDFRPVHVENFARDLGAAFKLVGVSPDFDLLRISESQLAQALAGKATVARSQHYYLDVTHPHANKGDALLEFAALLAVPVEEIAVIGDGQNDIAMFEKAGLAIAMGNAAPEVRNAADFVTARNGENGFAQAVEQFILPRLTAHRQDD